MLHPGPFHEALCFMLSFWRIEKCIVFQRFSLQQYTSRSLPDESQSSAQRELAACLPHELCIHVSERKSNSYIIRWAHLCCSPDRSDVGEKIFGGSHGRFCLEKINSHSSSNDRILSPFSRKFLSTVVCNLICDHSTGIISVHLWECTEPSLPANSTLVRVCGRPNIYLYNFHPPQGILMFAQLSAFPE